MKLNFCFDLDVILGEDVRKVLFVKGKKMKLPRLIFLIGLKIAHESILDYILFIQYIILYGYFSMSTSK